MFSLRVFFPQKKLFLPIYNPASQIHGRSFRYSRRFSRTMSAAFIHNISILYNFFYFLTLTFIPKFFSVMLALRPSL